MTQYTLPLPTRGKPHTSRATPHPTVRVILDKGAKGQRTFGPEPKPRAMARANALASLCGTGWTEARDGTLYVWAATYYGG